MPKTIKTTNNSSDTNPQSPVNKPKRGRKSKIELMAALNMQIIH